MGPMKSTATSPARMTRSMRVSWLRAGSVGAPERVMAVNRSRMNSPARRA